MGTIIKLLLIVVVVALIALIGYSYYPGSLVPDQDEVNRPVTLDVQ